MSEQNSAQVLPIFKGLGVPDSSGSVAVVVELLEEALVAARRGEVIGVAIAIINPAKGFLFSYNKGTCSSLELLGAATMLPQSLMNGWEDVG